MNSLPRHLIPPHTRAHLLAAIQAGTPLRAVGFVIRDKMGEPALSWLPLCRRSLRCAKCAEFVRHRSHIEMGVIHDVLHDSPIEVNGVAEATAPPAAHAFPPNGGEAPP